MINETVDKWGNAYCAICGKKLTDGQTKYCCTEHAHEGRKKETAERLEREKLKKPIIPASEIERRAMAEHLSYGKYCAKYGLA